MLSRLKHAVRTSYGCSQRISKIRGVELTEWPLCLDGRRGLPSPPSTAQISTRSHSGRRVRCGRLGCAQDVEHTCPVAAVRTNAIARDRWSQSAQLSAGTRAPGLVPAHLLGAEDAGESARWPPRRRARLRSGVARCSPHTDRKHAPHQVGPAPAAAGGTTSSSLLLREKIWVR